MLYQQRRVSDDVDEMWMVGDERWLWQVNLSRLFTISAVISDLLVLFLRCSVPGIQILWQIFWQKKVPGLKGITSSGVPNRFCSPVVVWGDVHCRLEKIDSPSYTSTGEGPPHAPCFKVRVTVDEHAFESPDFFKSRKAAEHVAVNVALMSVPFDGFQEASSLTESCHMPASVQGGLLSSPPMTHADCSLPSISDFSVGRLTRTQSYLL
ncbi:hypothetical protein Ddye_027154 [Dipteronia dyeriana]|uniref:DRBM domain-containing protein n=1 Tax=Dipteronia dyeriana TaxID=168575 RepID=A0AAD9WPX1_9ROSI|nr:hypothetical protein Ddye_027154 [Dipteronia dyeriana]